MGDPIKIGQIAAENPEVLPLVPIFGKIGQIGYEIAEIKRRADEQKQRQQIRQIVNNPANQRSTYIFSPRRPANPTTSTTTTTTTTSSTASSVPAGEPIQVEPPVQRPVQPPTPVNVVRPPSPVFPPFIDIPLDSEFEPVIEIPSLNVTDSTMRQRGTTNQIGIPQEAQARPAEPPINYRERAQARGIFTGRGIGLIGVAAGTSVLLGQQLISHDTPVNPLFTNIGGGQVPTVQNPNLNPPNPNVQNPNLNPPNPTVQNPNLNPPNPNVQNPNLNSPDQEMQDQEMGTEGENVPPTQEKIEIKEVFNEPSIVAPLLIGTAIGAATFFMVSK